MSNAELGQLGLLIRRLREVDKTAKLAKKLAFGTLIIAAVFEFILPPEAKPLARGIGLLAVGIHGSMWGVNKIDSSNLKKQIDEMEVG